MPAKCLSKDDFPIALDRAEAGDRSNEGHRANAVAMSIDIMVVAEAAKIQAHSPMGRRPCGAQLLPCFLAACEWLKESLTHRGMMHRSAPPRHLGIHSNYHPNMIFFHHVLTRQGPTELCERPSDLLGWKNLQRASHPLLVFFPFSPQKSPTISIHRRTALPLLTLYSTQQLQWRLAELSSALAKLAFASSNSAAQPSSWASTHISLPYSQDMT
jgi:hypothetical protein